jgi:hypothetical protein
MQFLGYVPVDSRLKGEVIYTAGFWMVSSFQNDNDVDWIVFTTCTEL